ncbi:MAG: germination protein YpeB [Clostridia bacterium]|nr:germination protein YpeB [Clostridia bacterium]
MKKLKRRTVVKIASFASAALIVAVGFAVSGYSLACEYREDLENGYRRALTGLSSDVSNMDTLLLKSKYASTPTMLGTIASEIWRSSGSAKTNLGMLPVTEASLDNVNKFLSQVGEYALFVSERVASGEDMTAEQTDAMARLSALATKVNDGLNELIAAISDKTVMLTEVSNKTNGFLAGINNDGIAISGGFADVENGFENYPTLIYDGPYSDYSVNKESAMLKEETSVSAEKARKAAAFAMDVSESDVTFGGENSGKLPGYYFYCGEKSAEITKAGGHLLTMTDGAEQGDELISVKEAVAAAERFLVKIGYNGMESTYHVVEYGVCSISFAYESDGVTCYPDIIKVGVSMTDGKVKTFDARGYITDHTERELPAPETTAAEAIAKLRKGLSAQSERLVVIPTDGGGEKYCWEIKCRAADGTKVLEYFNADSLREEDILILLEQENGVLTV